MCQENIKDLQFHISIDGPRILSVSKEEVILTIDNFQKYKSQLTFYENRVEFKSSKGGLSVSYKDKKDIEIITAIRDESEKRLRGSIEKSSSVFKNIVWPAISKLPIIGGGEIQSVEDNTAKGERELIDLYSGIDAWHIDGNKMRGVASRVGFSGNFKTFTIGFDEFKKRIKAIEQSDQGWLFPHLTVQAYVDKDGLLSAAVIRTQKLIGRAKIIFEKVNKENFEENEYFGILQNNNSGKKFIYIHWDYLIEQGILHQKDIFYKS